MLSHDQILSALKGVKYPGFSRDIVSFGLVKEASADNGDVRVVMQLTSGNQEVARQIQTESETILRRFPGVRAVAVDVRLPAGTAPSAGPNAPSSHPGGGSNPWSNQNRVPGVRRVVAVASGKGGVGKSTVSVNLACAFRHLGLRVGLLDCDIYGPSIPLMMGCKDRPEVTDDQKLVPPDRHGVRLMSIGFLIDDDQPVIWRGPMIVKTIQQFLMQTDWSDLDVLLVDLPPGTGDAQLTLCQTVPLDGGVVVTTPQEASLGVVRKGIAMFQKLNVPVLGIVENMSYFTAPDGSRVEIFGNGGGSKEAQRIGVPFLGEVPLFTEIREGGDAGIPVAAAAPSSPPGRAFLDVARQLQTRLA
ncbi:MAG: Mrp/NBP35 family ATP-binding protein [Verrucomicrobiales bacterium]|nr:Mrp/NBP35 family ATP-binding protein [Verrucomicrobiales bacterium]